MAYTPIPFGTPLWHNPVNAAFTSQDARITVNEGELAAIPPIGEIVPSDHNAIAWTGDPGHAIGTATPALGVLTMVRLAIRESVTLTSVAYTVAAAGTGLVAGQNFVGLYNSAGTLLRSTADQSANFAATGLHNPAWSTPVVVPAGAYWVAWLVNGATAPSLARGAFWSTGAASLNVGLTAADARAATDGAGLTALPTPVTMAGRTLSNVNYWAVLL